MRMPALFQRATKENPMQTTPETPTPTPPANRPAPIMHFRTRGRAIVDLYPIKWTDHFPATYNAHSVDRTGFQWECGGCDAFGGHGIFSYEKHKGYDEREPRASCEAANAHAAGCWAMPRPGGDT